MRRYCCMRTRHDPALSAMMDVFLVVLVVTVALVGTWVFSFSGESRQNVQLDEYNIHFATLSMERWLGSTVPEATVVDANGDPMVLRDQKVLELLAIELVLLKLGTPLAKFNDLKDALKAQLDDIMLPDHEYAANALETTPSSSKLADPYFFVSSEPDGPLESYEDAFEGHPTYTSAQVYQVPERLGGSGAQGPLQLTVNLACWVE